MSKFKVGDRDRVRVKAVKVGTIGSRHEFISSMLPLRGQAGVVSKVSDRYWDDNLVCGIDFDNSALDGAWYFADEWLELVEDAKQVVPESQEGVVEGDVNRSSSLGLISLLQGHAGLTLWSPLFGDCTLVEVKPCQNIDEGCIVVRPCGGVTTVERVFTGDGRFFNGFNSNGADCVLWPSRDCQTWDGWVPPRWRAEKGEFYWYVDSDGTACITKELFVSCDSARWELGNYFQLESQAFAAAQKFRELIRSLQLEE